MVDIDKKTLLQVSEYSPSTLTVLFLADEPRPEDFATIERISDELGAEQDPEGLLDVWNPERSPYGPVMFFEEHGLDREELEQFLNNLGARMDAAGFTGRLTAAQSQTPPIDAHFHSLWAFSAGLCTTVPEGQERPPQEVIDHALEWCRVPGGKFYVRYGLRGYLVSADVRRQRLEEALQGKGIISLTCLGNEDLVRKVVFPGQGNVVYTERYPGIDESGTWETGMDNMTEVLEETAASLEYGLVRRQHYGASDMWTRFRDDKWPENPRLRSGLIRWLRNWSHVAVPDAFGVMVLSPTHNWTPPPPEWSAAKVAGNRTLVRYNKTEPLFGDTHPDEKTVARMRADMAGILMTDDMVKRNK
jgi:hypothetical protein